MGSLSFVRERPVCYASALCGQFSHVCELELAVSEFEEELSVDPEVASVEEEPPRWSVL